MNREEMLSHLAELGAELEAREVTARVFIVGGAAMVIAHDSRYASDDIDADFYPKDDVLAAANDIAVRHNLSTDWLNSAALGFIPVFQSPDWRAVTKFGTLEISVADDRTMLAMKLRASRGQRDTPDIITLLNACGITDRHGALALYDEYFPEDPLPRRARRLLDAIFGTTAVEE